MKALCLLLVLCFTLQANAATGSLADLVSEHQYFVTVEWDQKDLNSLEAQNQRFIAQLQKGLSEGSISSNELQAFLVTQVPGQDLALMKQELKAAMTAGDQQGISEILMKVAQKYQARGANWSGLGIAAAVGGGIIVSLAILYTWFIHSALECDGFYDCHGGE